MPKPDIDFRIGHGYDLHRLEPPPPAGNGRPLVLGGLPLDAPRGPVSHSDGDAVLHAVADAILGALGEPDLGSLFPDTDPVHEGADSRPFVVEAVRRAMECGYAIQNVDITVICERPKIGPHRDRLRSAIAETLGTSPDCVNIKGKTHEGVDAVGAGEAIEVHVVALLGRKAASS